MSGQLTFEDVEHHVSCLPAIVVEHLALGPHPEADQALGGSSDLCRVCEALGEGGRRLPKGAHERDRMHAHELWTWHDIAVTDLLELAEELGVDGEDAITGMTVTPAAEETLKAVLGALSYARCCTIYALARGLAEARRS
jgi:hypothetical protein